MHWTGKLVLQPPFLPPPQTAYPHFYSLFALTLSECWCTRGLVLQPPFSIVTASPNSISPPSLSFLTGTTWVLMHWTRGLVLQPPLLPPPQTEYPHFYSLFALTLPECLCTGPEGWCCSHRCWSGIRPGRCRSNRYHCSNQTIYIYQWLCCKLVLIWVKTKLQTQCRVGSFSNKFCKHSRTEISQRNLNFSVKFNKI